MQRAIAILTACTLMAGLLGTLPTAGAEEPRPTIRFGMEASSVAAQTAAGVKPDFGTFWIGPWTLSSGWAGPDAQLTNMRNAGVTPAVHFYYWGDDISPSCVENGCWSSLHNAHKDRAGWEKLGQQMTDHFNAKMGGAPVLVFLESEFNKGGIETYEPFDAYLADMARAIKADYPNAEIVLGFGNWGSVHWGNFDRAAAASDMVGIQGMRGSTRQTPTQMYSLYDGLLAGMKTLEAKFPGKSKMITDIAVSSYPEPEYLEIQAGVLKEVFDNLETLKAHGVEAIIYRSWRDSPGMNLANYYGMAERYWGLTNSEGAKPSQAVWVNGVKAERAGMTAPQPAPQPAPTPEPAPPKAVPAQGGTFEAEAFAVRTAGGQQSDSRASGGKVWNLWSNGHVAQAFEVPAGDYVVTVRARGTEANGLAPHMVVSVGGAQVLQASPGTAFADHRATRALSGTVEVRVAFTNDARTSTEDRNLIVDLVSIVPVPANQAPRASFSHSAGGLTVQVDASGSSDPDGDALAFAWQFGDGATASGRQASHTYAAPGTYTVRLTVSDGRQDASTTQEVTALQPNRAPEAAFTASASHLDASFSASASDPDGDALTYAWAFGDGAKGSGASAQHTYASPGTYAVQLTVSDGQAATTRTGSVTVTAPPFTATIAVARGSNQWWQEVRVDASGPVAAVEFRTDGAWQPMAKRSWGNYASNVFVAQGTPIAFRATASDGQSVATEPQPWLGPAKAPTTTTSTTSPATTQTSTRPAFTATATPASGSNEWWVEAKVDASQPVAKVEAKAGTGAWVTLDKKSWGTYAKSFHVPKGTPVAFRVTATDGQSVTTEAKPWLSSTQAPATTATTTAFTATFSPKAQSNAWWVEVKVDASKPLAKVEARVDGGAWTVLPATDWGTHAKSLRAGDASVQFRATSTTGQVATSGTYSWG